MPELVRHMIQRIPLLPVEHTYAVAMVVATGLVAVAGAAAFGGSVALVYSSQGTDVRTTTITGSHPGGIGQRSIVGTPSTIPSENDTVSPASEARESVFCIGFFTSSHSTTP